MPKTAPPMSLARRALVALGFDAFAPPQNFAESVTTTVSPGTAIATTDPKQAVPVDEWGRPLTTPRDPLIGALYNARVSDRMSAVNPPWSPDQIADALRLAESGDLSHQSELFEHMEERDGRLHGYLNARRQKPSGLRWSIEPSDADDKEAVEIASFVQREIESISNWPHAMRDMFDAIGKGISALHINWQEGGRSADSRYRIDSIDWINTKRLRFDWQSERLLILPDDAMGKMPLGLGFDDIVRAGYGEVPPRWKVILHRSRTRTTHPAKGGVLRIVPFYFLFRNYGLKDWFIFGDKYGMPIRVGKYDQNAGDEEKNELLLALERIGHDGVAVISKMAEIEFLQTKNIGATVGLPFPGLRAECAKEMEFAILGQEQTNTENASGNRAKTESGGALVVQDILESDCIDAHGTLTPQLCYPIVGFSRYGWLKAQQKCPKFKFHYEPPADYASMSATDKVVHRELGVPTTLGSLAKSYSKTLPEGVDPDTIVVYTHQIPPGLEQKAVLHVLPPATVSAAPSSAEPDDPDATVPRDGDEAEDATVNTRRGRAMMRYRDLDLGEEFTRRTAASIPQRTIEALSDRAARAAVVAFERLDGKVQDLIAEVQRMNVSEDEKLRIVRDRLAELYDPDDVEEYERIVRRTVGTVRLFGMTTVRKPEAE